MAQMSESAADTSHYGYTVEQCPVTGRWNVFWGDKPMEEDFATQAAAEEWIDEQIQLNR